MASILVGEPIPMALKLYDNAPDKKVLAKVYSLFGDLLSSSYLYHVEDGLYMSSEVLMPDQPVVSVVYKIENSDQYADTGEQFYAAPKVQNDEKYVTGIVKSIETDTEYKMGIVYEIKNIEPVR